MEIIFYLSALYSPPFVAYAFLQKNKPPKRLWIFLPLYLLIAVGLAFLLLAFTLILDYEGNSSNTYYVLPITLTIIFIFSKSGGDRAKLAFFAWTYFWLVTGWHSGLAHSPSYTDNPEGRIKRYNVRRSLQKKFKKPPLPPIEVTPAWYTPISGLYQVSTKK